MSLCDSCKASKARVRRSASRVCLCCDCFFIEFENEVHETIENSNLFNRGEKVAIAVSGGKDSTVLIHLLSELNRRFDYGLNVHLLAIDEGIKGYRDESLTTVNRNSSFYGIPLTIVSYEDLYSWPMDRIVAQIGQKNNCTFCGVFRRQALDRGARLIGADKICTGHNLDDAAETVLMNIFRGDVARINRCSDIMTGRSEDSQLPRCKPLMYCYEKEIVLYAHFKRLDYFSTECVYSKNAYRGHAREFIKSLEAINPLFLASIVISSSQIKTNSEICSTQTTPGNCVKCGWITSNEICKACVLLEGLNSGIPEIAIANKSRVRKRRKEHIVISIESQQAAEETGKTGEATEKKEE